jgi:superfamily II DNA or RNA helicase
MKWTLRDYQQRACRKTAEAFLRGFEGMTITAALLIAATGAGKTIIACALLWFMARKQKGRCLFLADSDELVDQAVEKIIKATGIIPDVEKAERRASLRAEIVVSSIQSMQNRTDKFPRDHFLLVVADEAHLSMADSWQRVLWHFRRYEGDDKHTANPRGAHVLGITATPERADKKRLLDFYQIVTDEIPMVELIERRHLSPITVQTCPVVIPVSGVAKMDTDDDRQAEEIRPYYEAVISHILRYTADRRKVLIYHPSCAQSMQFTEMMQDLGCAAAHIDGKSRNREELLEEFGDPSSGLKYLNNKQLLIKGYDNPAVDTVVPLLACGSRTSYIQMAGRGTRLFCPHGCVEWCDHLDRKMDMLLLDFLWQFEGKNIMRPANLLCDSQEAVEALTERLHAGEAMDLLGANEEAQKAREAALIRAMKRAQNRQATRLDARSWAAVMHQPDLLDYEPTAKWEHRPATQKQLDRLEKWGIDPETVRGMGHAHKLMDAMVARFKGGLATGRQVYQLRKMGVDHAEQLTIKEASAMMQDKWRKTTTTTKK